MTARAASGALRVPLEQVPERIAALQAEVKRLRKRRPGGGGTNLDALVAAGQEVAGVKVIVGEIDAETPEQMRSAVDQLRQKAGGPAAVLVGSRQGQRATLIAGLSEDLVQSTALKAGDWVKVAAEVIGGRGGGKPTLAQAGCKDAGNLSRALEAGKEWICSRLGS